MIYNVGDSATITTELRDADGVLTAATVVLSVIKPDGTVLLPPVLDNGGVGKYRATVYLSEAKTWRYIWTASGTITKVDSGQLSVSEPGRVLVAGLDEFRAQLDRTDHTDDSELRLYLEAATDQVEWMVGPLSVVEVTETHRSAGRIALSRYPVVEVASVTPLVGIVDGPAYTTSDYLLDLSRGEVELARGMYGSYRVTYTVGRTSIPADIKLAGLIIAQHLWAVQNARFAMNAPGQDRLEPAPGSGFMVPYRALELLRPYISVVTVPGIA
jgi:hypothetical protein